MPRHYPLGFLRRKMKALVLLPIFFACFIEYSRATEGPVAKVGDFPWQVGILCKTTRQFCGGSLISKDWVLTAAHCVAGETQTILHFGTVELVPGDEGMKMLRSSDFIHHEHFDSAVQNDIALIKIPEPIEFTDNIKPIRLPKQGETVKAGDVIVASGWGSSCGTVCKKSVMSSVVLRSISNEECFMYYGPVALRSNVLCAISDNTTGICTGDSGGPGVVFNEKDEPVLHGIASFGSANVSAVGHPSGFVRTESMLDWISKLTGLSF